MKGRNQIQSTTESDAADPVRVLTHELGNVLNGMLGVTELLRSRDPRPEQERWLSALQQCSLQMSRLLEAFCGEPSEADAVSGFDGIELLEHTIISHAPSAQARGNTLLLLLDPDLPRRWRCSSRRLRQILDNLIANAVKFAPGTEIMVAARSVPGALELEVEDAGPGLRTDVAKRLFRPFQRNLHARGPAAPGSGLGLHVCRLNAEAMGGVLRWLRPASGGSCFRLTLPGAVTPSVRDQPLSPGRLLQDIRCELRLDGNLQRSVSGLLARHGVRCGVNPSERWRKVPGRIVVISGVCLPGSRTVRALEFQLRSANTIPSPRRRRLGLPILDSGLLEALLALVLDCPDQPASG